MHKLVRGHLKLVYAFWRKWRLLKNLFLYGFYVFLYAFQRKTRVPTYFDQTFVPSSLHVRDLYKLIYTDIRIL